MPYISDHERRKEINEIIVDNLLDDKDLNNTIFGSLMCLFLFLNEFLEGKTIEYSIEKTISEYIPGDKVRKVVIKLMEAIIQPNGELNYFLYAVARTIKPSYNNYKLYISHIEYAAREIEKLKYIQNTELKLNFCGELRESIAEIRRRILAEYEDQKIKENGDVEI